MRKPTVDYRNFRFSKLRTPEYSHLLLLLSWVVYFILYFITEKFIPRESCVSVHLWLDDVIPFCEYFVIPYTTWYVLVFGSLLYFALYDVKSFTKLQIYIIVTQVIAMAIYIAVPNRQDLRPEVFPRENFFTWVITIIYNFDTSTNVCPSLHVGYSLGILSVWLRKKDASALWKAFITVLVLVICISVAFVKQHSVADILAALPMCLVAELITYGKDYYNHFKKKL